MSALPPFQPPGIPNNPPPPTTQTPWPTFPPTYRELFEFEMPPTSEDISTTQTTAPWSGLNPPPVPLCYSYLDSTIPYRALQAFRGYLTHNDLWERRTPDTARTSWQQLRRSYQRLPITQESWLGNVLTLLNLIIEALLEDLGLAKALLAYEPHLQFSQHGDKDWLTTAEDYPDVIEKLIEVMNDAGGPERRPLGPPISRPMVGGGCAFELKLSKVLLKYSDFFAQPFNTFEPLVEHTQGHAIVFKLDLQMQNRAIARRVSSYAPRYGIVYTGHYFLLAENVHPLTILPPYSLPIAVPAGQPLKRGPPLTSSTPGATNIRGIGVSQIEHIVGGDDAPQFQGFLALLVAINAQPGILTIDGPNPQLAVSGFNAYNELYGSPNLQGGRSGNSRLTRAAGKSASNDAHLSHDGVRLGYTTFLSTLIQITIQQLNKFRFLLAVWGYLGSPVSHLKLPRVVIFQFDLDFLSQVPRFLVEISQDVLECRSPRVSWSPSEDSATSLFSPSHLSVHAFIHSNHQAYVYRGKLDGETVIIKAYEEIRFDGLLREIRAYNRLRSLPTVPKVIGVFAPPDMAWAALVIEDRGTSLASEHRWETLPLNDRVAIYNAAANVHLAGVHHGDLEARNFVRDTEGRLSIVDFGHATVDHACEPGVCVELNDLRQNLGL
ncbi:hypothetical protein DFH09DRAFT_1144489 [Mycena vulgaris]|nr:hypothetical protein DFH09DRAFT_1144489 [Mycena vulgaris]